MKIYRQNYRKMKPVEELAILQNVICISVIVNNNTQFEKIGIIRIKITVWLPYLKEACRGPSI
uniref:Uncharacterized protein n=1 Tax=Rhizophora mucronata TaxID=61149 RepID=A0A2P2PRD6_RHIMU